MRFLDLLQEQLFPGVNENLAFFCLKDTIFWERNVIRQWVAYVLYILISSFVIIMSQLYKYQTCGKCIYGSSEPLKSRI